MTTGDELLDLALKHEIESRRFARGVERRIIGILTKGDAALRERMLAALRKVDAGRFSVRDLAQLVATIRRDVSKNMKAAEAALGDELEGFAGHEMDWIATAINKASPVEFAIEMPAGLAAADVEFDGRAVPAWFKSLDRDKAQRLASVVRLGRAEGSTVEEMSRAVAEAFDTSRTHARALVRTATTATGTQARQALLEANEDIIKGARWISTLDGRTSAVCRARDGTVFPTNRGPRPPAHPNCRSVVVPVLKSWQELGFNDLPDNAPLSDRPFVRDKRRVKDIPKHERAGLVGTVKATERYETWLRRQDADFQDDVLGKAKGALFRRGGLGFDKFVDESGKEYTLAELRQREAAAFRRAGVR